MITFIRFSAIALFPLTLIACGGGSPANSSATSTAAPALSETQKNFESMALSGNKGLHYLSSNLDYSFSATNTPIISRESFFYAETSSIAQTAIKGAQPVTASKTMLASTLLGSAHTKYRNLVDGTVHLRASQPLSQITYTGNDVLHSIFAADGKTVVVSTLTTSSTVSPLTGLISNSPQELVANSDLSQIIGLPFSAFLFNTSMSWQSGSAYMKTLGKTYGDRVYVYDCGSPITESVDITPCPGNATTLEQIFPSAGSDGNTLSFNDGQITTLAGVRAWIANAALPLAETGILTYRMYYQNKGKIYKASLIKDGTLLQGPTTGSTLSPHFNIYFNNSAIQSIKSALKF